MTRYWGEGHVSDLILGGQGHISDSILGGIRHFFLLTFYNFKILGDTPAPELLQLIFSSFKCSVSHCRSSFSNTYNSAAYANKTYLSSCIYLYLPTYLPIYLPIYLPT